jgi:two-component system alkaline phosphatase synthesis response regulator PhoP
LFNHRDAEERRELTFVFLCVFAVHFEFSLDDTPTSEPPPAIGRRAEIVHKITAVIPEVRMPSPARVLIVDDNPQGVELLEAYLEPLGAEVKSAGDGEVALKLVKDWRPDLVLLDIMMPKMSGFEVCKRLRANPATKDVAVLMVTALDQPSDIERAVEAGTDDFLTKPVNKTELVLRVKSLLKGQQYKNELDRVLAYMESVQKGS